MPAVAAVVGAIGGGIAGGQKDEVGNSTTGGQRIFLAPESALGKQAAAAQGSNFDIFGNLVNAGANQQDVTQAAGSQRSLADLLQQYASGGYQPTQQDVTQAGTLADQLLAPSFRQQGIQADRLAAQLGRPVNDPIIQAKLRQGEAEQRGTFIAQQAQAMPLQRLGFASQLSDVRNSLASQAMANRQAILGIGGQILGQEQGMQVQGASRDFIQNSMQNSGGGFKGAFNGMIGGAGAGLSMGAGGK